MRPQDSRRPPAQLRTSWSSPASPAPHVTSGRHTLFRNFVRVDFLLTVAPQCVSSLHLPNSHGVVVFCQVVNDKGKKKTNLELQSIRSPTRLPFLFTVISCGRTRRWKLLRYVPRNFHLGARPIKPVVVVVVVVVFSSAVQFVCVRACVCVVCSARPIASSGQTTIPFVWASSRRKRSSIWSSSGCYVLFPSCSSCLD